MNKTKIEKNLKHGYIFLALIILVPFSISFIYETYTKGGFAFLFTDSSDTPSSYPVTIKTNPEKGKPKLEIQGISDGFKTKDSSVSIVAQTDANISEAVINNETVKVDDSGRFERKVDLIVGTNQITVTVKNDNGENSLTFNIIREEEPKSEPTPAPNPQPVNPTPQPQPVNPTPAPQPTPTPTPEPPPPPPPSITGLKMSCSINNTHPFVGQSVSINCSVKDQNNNAVSGAFGYVTVNWKSGNSVYTLSQSDGGGNMSASFTVPAGNSGSVSGNVQVSKNGLNVSSNFNLTIQ